MTAPKIPTPPPAVEPPLTDTQKLEKTIRTIRKIDAMIKDELGVKENEAHTIKQPPFLLAILLMLLFGLGSLVILLTLRPDLDFTIVSIGIFALIGTLTASVFSIMKSDQTIKMQDQLLRKQDLALQQTQEANEKSQLVLTQSQENHKLFNSSLTEYKQNLVAESAAREKIAELAAHLAGMAEGRDKADKRTDELKAEKNPSV